MAHPELTKEEVKKLAKLSRIAVSDEEIEVLRKDFGSILNYISVLESATVEDGAQSVSMPLTNVFRDDKEREAEIDREALLSQLPKRSGDHLKLKEVIEGGGR